LAAALRQWKAFEPVTPDDSDADGVARSRHLEELGDAEAKRLEPIQRTSSALTTSPPEYLEDIRQDWPD
jgi:hypothetical protein